MKELQELKESSLKLIKILENSLDQKIKEVESISENKDKYIELINNMKEWNERKRHNTRAR